MGTKLHQAGGGSTRLYSLTREARIDDHAVGSIAPTSGSSVIDIGIEYQAPSSLFPRSVVGMTVQRFGCLWTEEQIVEIVTVSAMFGFLNRWNDTLATPLEDNLLEFAEKHLAAQGWEARQAPTVASLRPALWVTLTPKK